MEYFNLILLGIIQGLTEFLPVSSSGHLVFAQHFLGIKSPGTVIEVILHLGTLTSILFFYKKDIFQLITKLFEKDKNSINFSFFVLIGILPAGFAGVFFKDFFTSFFSNVSSTGYFLIFTGIILFSSKFMEHKGKSLSLSSVFMVGLIQAFSIFPGISRSGMTISLALILGIEKEQAFKFSFFLAIPIIFGATLLEIPHILILEYSKIFPLIIGFFTSAISGYLALNLLFKIIIKNKFWIFSIYCFIVGALGIYYAG